MSVSIVIPVYNEEAYLSACLSAIAQQTEKPDEVIVVDNNSTDHTLEIARAYPFVQALHESRQGTVFAQRAGFNAAKSTIIARVDADSVVPPDWVARINKAFRTYPETSAITGAARFYDIGLSRLFDGLQVLTYQRMQKLLTGTFIVWGANMAIRRSAWRQVESHCSTRTGIDEDIDMSFCLHKQSFKVQFLPDLLIGASFQRGQTGVRYSLRYLSTWRRDYWLHKMYVRGCFVAIGVWFTVLLSAPLMFVLRSFPPKRS